MSDNESAVRRSTYVLRDRYYRLTTDFLRILWLALRRPLPQDLLDEMISSVRLLARVEERAPWRLLHASIECRFYHPRFDPAKLPSLRVVRFLLQCGFSPNSCSINGELPLVFCARRLSPGLLSSELEVRYRAVGCALIEHGAHWDARDDWSAKYAYETLPSVNPIHYMTLQCLASRVIKRHNIPFRDIIPRHLDEFVNIH